MATVVVSPPGDLAVPDLAAMPGRKSTRRRRYGWLYLTPLVLALTMWLYGPMAFSGVLSVVDWDLTSDFGGLVGLANYRALLGRPEFLGSLARTVLFSAAMLPLATVVPMLLAVTLWRRPGRAATVYRALLFLPVMVPPVAYAVSWRFLLNPLNGLVNEVLGWFGAGGPNWLGDPATAPFVVVAITAPRIVATNMLLYTAALAALDRRTLDAARVDGATSGEVTRFVVVPQLRGTTILLGLLSVVLAGQWVFNNVAILTQGGPDGATDTVYFHIYTLGFTFFDTGTASAASMLVLLAVAAAGLLGLVVRRARWAR